MKTILAPIDFSPVSDAVVTEAAALARAHQARVVLLNVVQRPHALNEYAPLMGDIVEITAAGERNAARKLEKIEAKLTAALVAAQSIQMSGSPIPNIVEQAGRLQAAYIVMGSHGHTALYDLLVGSTTHGVLLRSKCPVVIIPAIQKKHGRAERKARRMPV